MSSSIYLTENFLKSEIGDAIILADSGVIGTSQVGSNVSNPMLSLSNYRRTANNVLLNPKFDTGTLANWSSTGSPVVEVGNFPGVMYELNVGNLNSVSQQITGFQNLHPIFELWHRGQEIILSLEIRDGSNVYLDGVNRTIPYTENWTQISIGMYNYFLDTTNSVKITIASVWDDSIIANCSMIGSDYYSSVNIGDEYNSDITDIVRVGARKLMIGPGLPSINSSILDIRGNSYFLGDLTVTGTITSGPIFGSIGTQKWVSNIIFSSGSQTQINFTSGSIQLVSGQIFGISSGNTGTMSQISYLYLDSDVSSSVLQITTNYSLVIGANKIFIGTCYPGTTGYASFVSQSNNLPLINASDLITPFSIINGNMAINSITASNIVAGTITGDRIAASTITAGLISVSNLSSLNANLGTITAGIITLAAGGSYLNFGALPPTSSSGSIGLAGAFVDYTGFYMLTDTTLNASLTSAGFTSAGGNLIINSNGINITVTTAYSNIRSYKLSDASSNILADYYSFKDTGASEIYTYIKSSAIASYDNYAYLQANTITSGQTARAIVQAVHSPTSKIGSLIVLANNGSTSITAVADTFISNGNFQVGGGNYTVSSSSGDVIQNGSLTMQEIAAPSSPSTDKGVLYLQDNGSGKTQLMIKFTTGAAQQIAIQP